MGLVIEMLILYSDFWVLKGDIQYAVYWCLIDQKVVVMKAKTDGETSKKKLTFFGQKVTFKKFLQPRKFSNIWESQEGLERCPD